MKILIYGTSPLIGSGYASVVRYVSLGLKARGHEVSIFGWNSHAGQALDWHGITIYPRTNMINGADGLAPYVRHTKADIVLAVCDPWVMGPDQWRAGHGAKVIHWYPCQSEPASGALCDVVQRGSDASWCYSQWGTDVMSLAGVTSSYVPLGIAPETYKPLDRAACRADFEGLLGRSLKDEFLVGMVAANSSTVPIGRKAFDQALLGFRSFLDDVAPNAVLYLHTWATASQGGFELQPILKHLGLLDRVHFADPTWYYMGLPDSWMAKAYNAFDVCLQATSGEGFGLPILEAQACGTPVVTTNYSSMPELTAYGLTVEPACRLWSPQPMDGWVAVPDPDGICNALETVYSGELLSAPEDGLALARDLAWDRIIDAYVVPELDRVSMSVASTLEV